MAQAETPRPRLSSESHDDKPEDDIPPEVWVERVTDIADLQDTPSGRREWKARRTLARMLCSARRTRGLDLTHVAGEVGVSRAHLIFLEHGYLRPDEIMASTLIRLSRLLHIPKQPLLDAWREVGRTDPTTDSG